MSREILARVTARFAAEQGFVEAAAVNDQVLALKVAALYREALSTDEDDSDKPAGHKGKAPPRWKEWLDATQQGGKRKVPNPSNNPLSRDRAPQVSFSTALRNKQFYQKAMEAFKKWSEKTPEKGTAPGKGKPEAKPEVEQKPPEQVEQKAPGKQKAPEEPKAKENGDHEESSKKSWKDRIRDLGTKAKAFVESAPKEIKKFLEDEGHRRKVIQGIHSVLEKAPEKLVKDAIKTVKDEVKEYKEASQGIAAVLKGKKMSKHQKKAVKTVALHLAISIAASAVVGGGVLGVAGAFAKGTAQTLAMKSMSKALGHVAVLQEVSHIGHGVAEFVHHLASTGSPLFLLYKAASQVKVGAEPDVDEVFGNFMAANVSKELETFGSDDDIEASLRAMDEDPTEEFLSDDEDADTEEEEESIEEEPVDEEEPEEDEVQEEPSSPASAVTEPEGITKINLESLDSIKEIWFIPKKTASVELISRVVSGYQSQVSR